MKRNRIVTILMTMLLLSSCGEALEICKDDNKLFPEEIDMPNFTLRNRYETTVEDFTTRFNQISEEEKDGYENALTYAKSTNLKDTASLPNNVKYIKLFDGEISCAGSVANSRLHLYSSGVIVDLARNLKTADRIGVYMTSSYMRLKIEATITLYKLVDRLSTPYVYDAYDFNFVTSLMPNSLEPYFYSFLLSSLPSLDIDGLIVPLSDALIDCSMIGFSYQRLDLTQEEISSGKYVEKIEDEKDSPSFIKIYDISLPNSTWTRP